MHITVDPSRNLVDLAMKSPGARQWGEVEGGPAAQSDGTGAGLAPPGRSAWPGIGDGHAWSDPKRIRQSFRLPDEIPAVARRRRRAWRPWNAAVAAARGVPVRWRGPARADRSR